MAIEMSSPRSNEEWVGLVDLVCRGDEDGTRRFADALGLLARAFFRRAGRSLTDAEALAVSCVTDIVLVLPRRSFDGQNFSAWVHRIFKNTLASQFRRRPDCVPLQESDLNRPIQAPARNGILDVSACAALEDALASLRADERKLIEFRHAFQALPYKEAARELEISVEAARVRYARALNKIEKLLRNDPRMKAWIEMHT